MEEMEGRRARVRPLRLWSHLSAQNLAWLGLIALACLALRLPALDRVALNPDESQYEATASYLVGTGRSAFSLTYGVPATIAVYKAAASLFGPYSMPVVRLGVLAICLAMSWLIFVILRRTTAAWCAGLGALIFLHMNIFFEGHSANREWFAGFFLLAGVFLCLESLRRRESSAWLLMGLAGVVSGISLWFKLQALPLVLAIPLFLCWRAWSQREWRDEAIRTLLYAGGGCLATVAYSLCFLWAGSLSGFVEFVGAFSSGYVFQNEAAQTSTTLSFSHWLQRYWLDLSGRGLWMVIYGYAGVAIAAGVYRSWRGPRASAPSPLEDTLAIFVAFLGMSMIAVGMGQRFYSHYYLLMLPAVAVLYALAAHTVAGALDSKRLKTLAAVLVAAGLGLEATLKWSDEPLSKLLDTWPSSAATTLYWVALVALAGWLIYAALRSRPQVSRAATGLLILEGLLLMVQAQGSPVPQSLPYHPRGYSHLVEELERRSQAGDRLFVWGWAPEIYSVSRLEAASHFSITSYIVQDYQSERATPGIHQGYAEMLMRDLRERQPRFVVDATMRSWTMAGDDNPRIYALGQYPDFKFARWLRSEYRPVGLFDGTRLYLRR